MLHKSEREGERGRETIYRGKMYKYIVCMYNNIIHANIHVYKIGFLR